MRWSTCERATRRRSRDVQGRRAEERGVAGICRVKLVCTCFVWNRCTHTHEVSSARTGRASPARGSPSARGPRAPPLPVSTRGPRPRLLSRAERSLQRRSSNGAVAPPPLVPTAGFLPPFLPPAPHFHLPCKGPGVVPGTNAPGPADASPT